MEENKENVVEETTPKTEQPVDDNTTKVDISGFKTPEEDNVIKVDLSKPKEEPVEEVVKEELTEEPKQVVEEVVEEVTPQEAVEEQPEEVVTEETVLPENVEKLVEFMNETGGSLEDYVSLNKDYKEEDDSIVLEDYYRKTKPHLTDEEINFMLEDRFSYDEDTDDDKEIRRKKLALKEQVADAKAHLDGLKSKYYEDVKARQTKPNDEYQKAMDFFNRYNKESESAQKVADEQKSIFIDKTNKVFNDEFKGFEYKVGDKNFRFNVNNASEVRDTQSDINNFVRKFLNKDNTMKDAAGYHKSLFTAMNPDAIANHFYEQGKADALKQSVADAKNVNVKSRSAHNEGTVGGLKFKVIGESARDFKVKLKK